MGAVGSQTAASLVMKNRSSKLAAGLPTMVSLTRRHLRKMPARLPKKGKGCGEPCAPTRKGAQRVRSKTTCKCVVPGGQAARKEGICGPRKFSNGVHETVLVTGRYTTGRRAGKTYSRCVKAGGSTAKELGTSKGCPAGKILKSYTTQVPTADGRMKTVQAKRCVKAVGALKDCAANLVLATKVQDGVTPQGRPYSKRVTKCVTPQTASKGGYTVVRQGSLPVKAYHAAGHAGKKGRRATAGFGGNGLIANWSGAGVPSRVAMSVGMSSGMASRRMSARMTTARRMSARMTTARFGGGGMLVNWSGTGVPSRVAKR